MYRSHATGRQVEHRYTEGGITFEYISDYDIHSVFIFQFHLSPQEIACLYKHRWKIELFFKWIKQHLKIKPFWGTTENAVKTQVYIAIITYTLVAIVRQRLKTAYTNFTEQSGAE